MTDDQSGPLYEQVDAHGRVIQRVRPLLNDYEDNRIGSLVLEGRGGWRLAGTQTGPLSPGPAPATNDVDESAPAGWVPVGEQHAEPVTLDERDRFQGTETM